MGHDFRRFGLAAPSLALLASLLGACGSDDKNTTQPAAQEQDDGGAPAVPPSYPPALGPEDCATTTSKITLTQPSGAAVWGGLALLEFTVEGNKVDSFDVQAFDPSLQAWTNNYVGAQYRGQRDDGSYMLAVNSYVTAATKDQPIKLRVRPSQTGCPDADWTETEEYTVGDPLVGTSWKAEIPGSLFTGELNVQRNPVVADDMLDRNPTVRMGDATLSMSFGKKGTFTETAHFALEADADDAPYAGCVLNLAFAGTYQLILREGYGLVLAVSEQTLTSSKGTTCDFPKVAEMAFSADTFKQPLNAFTRQGISINYLPTLYVTPGAPIWEDSSFGQIFQQLPQFLNYTTEAESGTVNGYPYPQNISFEQQ